MKQTLTLILMLISFSLSISAQKNTLPLPVNPAVKTGKLSNGLTYYIRKNQEPKNRAELRLVVNAGSILESDKQVGMAHFVEHMSFNGTQHFKKNELVNFLEKSGVNFGADLNASTSFDETIYELQVPTDSPLVYKQAMQILEDWAHGVSFEPAEIDKERGVIVEEWRLGRGADARLRDKYFPILLKGSQYAKRLPIGTKSNIDTAHHTMLTSYYKDWYRPDLQAIIVVGDVDLAETEKMIKEQFEKIPATKDPRKRIQYSIPAHAETRTAILTDAEQPYNIVQIYYTMPEVPAVKTAGDFRAEIVRELFNQMMSSRLDEISQKPTAPFLFGSSSYGGFIGDKDAFTLLAVAKKGKDITASIQTLLTENERVKQYGFVQTELDRAVKNTFSRIENSYHERDKTKSAELVQELIEHYLKGEAIPGIEYEYSLYQKLLPTIALTEVNSLIKFWTKATDRSIVITAPETEKKNLPSKAVVLAQLNKPLGKLKKYTDKVSNGPLLPVTPVAGKVVSEKKYDAIGTTEWILSNGARVVLKPTDFKNDDIQFSCISWGGSSLYNDSDYINAANAAIVASVGGMGNLDMQALQKALTGKNCYVAPSLSATMQGMNGNSNIKDLETAFQLLHGSFVAPRKDANMFNVILQQFTAQMENKDKDPRSVFADSVSYIMGNYHPRRRPFTTADLKRLNLDRAFDIYKERFKNAGQFLFTFVGNFKTDSIKPLVETYIASLPGTTQKDTYKDVGIRYPIGQINKIIYKGKENKAGVRLYFTGNTTYDETANRQLGQLCKALGIKLRELLREDAGGVYGVGVSGGITREPFCNYSIGIQFGCAPENVNKLVAMIMEEIKNTKANGVAQVNVDKVIAEQTRSLENEVKENSYWRYQVEQQFFRNEDPLSILDASKKIQKFTVERSKVIATQFFDEQNVVRLVLLPEEK
ncbi:MAG: insulinase family protein [Chitinophagaceae bacterium]|nr:insulinase family protein [Chitinophagaceae bacterium]